MSRGRARGGAASWPPVHAPQLRDDPLLPSVVGPHLPATNNEISWHQSRDKNALRACASVPRFRLDQHWMPSREVLRTIGAEFVVHWQLFSPFLLAGWAWLLTFVVVWAWLIP